MSFDRKNPNKPKNLAVKFIYNFLSLQKQSQLGNTLAVGVGIGLIAVAGTTASLMKASKDKTNVISDEGTKQALAVAEAGIQRSLGLFSKESNQYLLLAKYNQGWTLSDAGKTFLNDKVASKNVTLPANPCISENDTVTFATDDEKSDYIEAIIEDNTFEDDLMATNVGTKGKPSLVGYEYVGGKGELTVKGEVENTGNKASYKVTFDVNTAPGSSGTPPAKAATIIAPNQDLNKMDVFATSVICTDLSKCNKAETAPPAGSCVDGQLAVDTTKTYANLSDTEKNTHLWLEESLGMDTNGKVRDTNNAKPGQILITTTTVPPIPRATTGAKIINLDYNTGNATVGNAIASSGDNNNLSASANWSNLFSSNFDNFWRWIDPPAYANTTTSLTINLPTVTADTSTYKIKNVLTSPSKGRLDQKGSGNDLYYTYTYTGPTTIEEDTTDTFKFSRNGGENDVLVTVEIKKPVSGSIIPPAYDKTADVAKIEGIITDITKIKTDLQAKLAAETNEGQKNQITADIAKVDAELLKANNALTTAKATTAIQAQVESSVTTATNALTEAQKYSPTAVADKGKGGKKDKGKAEDDENDPLVDGKRVNGNKSGSSFTLNVAEEPYKDNFNVENIGGVDYDVWYIQLSNYTGNNDLDIRVDNLNTVGTLDADGKSVNKKQIRIYIPGDLDMQGNAAIQAVDENGDRVTATTTEQLEQISAIRIIGGNATGAQPVSQTWAMKGTTCTMGMIHAPVANITYSGGGNGCGSSGGESPITLNSVAGMTGTIGGSTATPNHFGSMWINGLTGNGNSSALYENTKLSEFLSSEFGNGNFIGGSGTTNSINMGNQILTMTREAVN